MKARSTDKPRIAAIIPCYNEATSIAAVIRSLPPIVDLVLVIDDASTDRTTDAALATNDPRVTVIRNPTRLGVGGAVRRGYEDALAQGMDICVKLDGDGQMDGGDLPALVQPLLDGTADYAKGNRFADTDALRAMPTIRLIGNGMLSFLTKLASGYWSTFDPTNGYTAVMSTVLRRLRLSRLDAGFFFESSMLIELNILGAVVADVDMPARYGDEDSALRIGHVTVTFPWLLTRGLLRRFFWRYMIRDFNALTLAVLAGLPTLLFGIIFGAYHWWRSVGTGVPATAGTTILAALPIIVGSQLLLTALVLDVIFEPRLRQVRLTGTADPRST